jgi:DNA-binding NarL/FixJ family response regulator
MNMKSRNSEIIEVVNGGKEQDLTSQNKIRTLIVSDNPTVKQELSKLINHNAELGICIEAKGTDQTQGAIGKQQIDLAIVDISSKDTNGFRIADTTRFQYLNIPIVLLSMHDKALHGEHTSPAKNKGYLADQKATEQIIKAISYAQSLLRSHIFGFTLAVEIERSPRNDH